MLYDSLLQPGDRIVGKWRGNQYVVIRCLGKGANGQVYLAEEVARQHSRTTADGARRQPALTGVPRQVALKVGYDPIDFQSEINGLLELQKMSEGTAKWLYLSDDFRLGKKEFPFYTMKYVEGVPPARFLYENGMDWFPVIGYRLLAKLAELHARGYIFGDLKSDNILVSGYGTTELIDYGGLTVCGKAVRQYTERYDRGYWQAGSRSADGQYDLFAFAITCVEMAEDGANKLRSLESKPTRSVDDLCHLIEELPHLRKVAPLIMSCLQGRMPSAADALVAWRRMVYSSLSRRSEEQVAKSRLQGRASIAMTAGLVTACALSLAVFGVMLYWTLHPAPWP